VCRSCVCKSKKTLGKEKSFFFNAGNITNNYLSTNSQLLTATREFFLVSIQCVQESGGKFPISSTRENNFGIWQHYKTWSVSL
jgi:hypothetical protein